MVPSSGCNLVDFLSRLDRVVRDLAEAIFSSKWDMEAAKACSGLEDESLSDVICEDFIRVLNIVDVPMAALSIYYKYITVSGDESSLSDSGSSSELGSSSSKLPVASSVSTSAIEEPSTAPSSGYFRVPPKKLFIMQGSFSGSRTPVT
ncbi:hypothetical protein [Candidatus Ichthyocystis sparus]|uniref:hypothetical protein n=1 Tax=Candidatus Ichthyocystis sparus TaxID=1561004 RepID=UPI001147502C|nr:hypothetical protein [Candidatus Ichthyocystis sparus]